MSSSCQCSLLYYLRPILWKIAGFLMSIYPALDFIVMLFKKGPGRVLHEEERLMLPEVLKDPRWGDHKYAHLPGVKIHYVEKGDPSKPLMLFLHGFPEFWFSWRYQLEYFSKDYWCVAPDLRGYGDSDKPSGVHNYSIDLLAGDVRNLIRALGRERCILVAHDWGASIGYSACHTYPEMFHCYLSLNLPHPVALMKELEEGWEQRLKSWYIAFFQCPVLPERFLKLADNGIFDTMFADMKKPQEHKYIEAYKYTFRDSMAFEKPLNYYRHVMQYPKAPPKEKLRVPVFSLFGTGDAYLSVAANKRSRDYIETFEDEYLEGVSHWVMTEDPDRVNKAMEKYLKKSR